MSDIADLARRFSRKLETGKGMQLAPADLALLGAIGVNDLIQTAAADFLRKQCQQRVARNQSIAGGSSGFTQGDPGADSRSSGTTQTESGSEAAERARRTRLRPVPRSTPSTSKRTAAARLSAPHADARASSGANP